MPTLKTTVSLESTTLFPTPVAMTKIVTENINGEYSSFQTNVLPAAEIQIIFDTNEKLGNSGTLYMFCQAASTNSAHGVDIWISNKSSSSAYFMRLGAGDVAYLPLYAADTSGITVSARNNDPTSSASISYFFGAKD